LPAGKICYNGDGSSTYRNKLNSRTIILNYLSDQEPFQSLSALADKEALKIMEELSDGLGWKNQQNITSRNSTG